MRILVVEDDAIIADGIRVGLGLAGLTVDCVSTCAEALEAIASSAFDAVVLDLMLPDGSGLEVLRDMRSSGFVTPVLILTALDQVPDRIRGLDCGADDHLGKPFDLGELAARLRALTRRATGRAAPSLTFGEVALHPERLVAIIGERSISLSPREFSVLSALMERPGVIRSKVELEERLYGWQEGIESNTVEVHVHKLRTKIGREFIETVRGAGYRIKT